MNHFTQIGLLTALLTLAATASIADAAASANFLPGVAVNPQQTHAFATAVDGRLMAIDIADGSIRWRSTRQLEALGFAGGRVIAWALVNKCAHCLQLVWLSEANGSEQRTSTTITLPDWVSVEPALGKQFKATVEPNGASLALHWKASNRYAGGAHPTSRVLADFKKDAAGTFMIDPDGRAIVAMTSSEPPSAIPRALRPVKSTTYWNCADWRDVSVVDSDGMVAFELSTRLDGQTL